jgi:hypothetical protein
MDKRLPSCTILTMKMILTTLTALMIMNTAEAANYKYNELLIKDYDEMLAMVQSFAKKARDAAGEDESGGHDAEAIEQLREALKLIYSRPDSDNMVAKLVAEVRRDLIGYSAFEDSISSIAAEALENVQNKNAAVSTQSTSLFILENILGQIHPEIAGNPDLRRVTERIRDAKLKVTDDVIKDRKLRGMFKTRNPSEIATDMLKKFEEEEKKKKKKK